MGGTKFDSNRLPRLEFYHKRLIMNSFLSLGVVSNFGSFWQIFTTIAIVAVLIFGNSISGAPSSSFEQVFFTYYNNTGQWLSIYTKLILE